jgi:hypothetical protein
MNVLLVLIAAVDAQTVVDDGLAPFVAVGTITAECTAVAAFAAKVEAINKGWDEVVRNLVEPEGGGPPASSARVASVRGVEVH